MAVKASKQIISFITAPIKYTFVTAPNEKKHFLTAPRENVNSLTAQNVEKKLSPTHQTNQFCCVQPYYHTIQEG
jgi:hypothetical protein